MNRLKCPHNKEIEICTEYGLITYKHKKGSYCSLLNSFKTKIKDVSKHIIEKAISEKDKNAVYACFGTANDIGLKEAHDQFYVAVSKYNSEKLIKFLKEVIAIDNEKLDYALRQAFGETFLKNIKYVETVLIKNQPEGRYPIYNSLAKYPMIKLYNENKANQSLRQNISKQLADSFKKDSFYKSRLSSPLREAIKKTIGEIT